MCILVAVVARLDGDESSFRELVQGVGARVDDLDHWNHNVATVRSVDDVHGEARREVARADVDGTDRAEALGDPQLRFVGSEVGGYEDLATSVVVEMPSEAAVEPGDLEQGGKSNGDRDANEMTHATETSASKGEGRSA